MNKINFPLTLEQIQNIENQEITDIFVKRVCSIHNKEAKLDENFTKLWKDFYKKYKSEFKGNSNKTIFREDWKFI